MSSAMVASRSQLGLPENATFDRLLFNEATGAVIVAMVLAGPLTPVGRLYWRKSSWRKYRALEPATADVSMHCPVTGAGSKLFFLATTFCRTATGVGGDDPAIGMADMRDGKIAYLRPLFEDGTPVPIGELTGVSRTGKEVFCSVGFRDKRPLGPHVVYRMSRLLVANGEVSPLTLLPGVFY
jgi:hypothetical protein